ncbi:Hypothetical protein, putative [Bodo saltans]|uniref:Uncharacterized protein n=1 Tax=Bodo saltans TaxID=75058 RepID=A0A0S4J7Z3_BODSA|nr:Hypothetical protein, putative [Bodo saltans]|eukprot:CUG62689.1 Hypothetical protein, putative [Bodo saltans]
MSTALPFGGPTDSTSGFRGPLKVVDRSNAYSKFSKRSPNKGMPSNLFDPNVEVPASRPVVINANPLQGGAPQVSKPLGLRITKKADSQQEEPQKYSKRIGYQPPHENSDNACFTAFGQRYGGKTVVVHTNQESGPAKDRNERDMARFRQTPRPESNVLLPQTLQDSTPRPKAQRFQTSTRFGASLVGVLGDKPPQDPTPRHRVQPPWHTAE